MRQIAGKLPTTLPAAQRFLDDPQQAVYRERLGQQREAPCAKQTAAPGRRRGIPK